MIHAYAAQEPGGTLSPFSYDPGPLGEDEVDIKVDYCGICHSDLSMLDNEWGMTTYPFVPGHEVIGTVYETGRRVTHLSTGQRVGLGWFSHSCMTCHSCMSGDHNLYASAEGTIVGRHGGFSDRVRAHSEWVIPLPEKLNPESAGPLFCGGVTVFNPIVQFGIKPTDRVGVIGIGGLGHMAIRFLRAWGCEVTAFSHSSTKCDEAKSMGATHFVDSRDARILEGLAGSFDFVLSTVNKSMDWDAYIATLKPRGRLHLVGAVLDPVSFGLFPMLLGQKSLSSSPLGSPATTSSMLDFAARHAIEPKIEMFDIKDVNEAMSRLREGKAHYRLVLKL